MTHRRSRRTGQALVLAAIAPLLFLVVGCAPQPYVSGYSYYPQPAVVNVVHRGQNQTPVTVLASVLGVRNADKDRHIPYAIAIRLRFENNGPSEAFFDPASLELVTGSLRGFPPPRAEPAMALNLAPGQRQDVTAYFPFPPGMSPGQINVNNLRLRWQIRIDNYSIPQSALFQRGPDGDGGGYDASPADSDLLTY